MDPEPDCKTWTFDLRKGVKFHDGTPFNATAVCANFDRWFNMAGAAAQSQMIYYGDVFEGFKKNEGDASGEPVYKELRGQRREHRSTEPQQVQGRLPGRLRPLGSFAMSSPEALKKYDADKVTQSSEAFSYSSYANEHPTGTGAFKFESYDKTVKTVTLVRNDDYWGEKAEIVFKTISDENARKQELRAKTIDGYDLVSPQDYQALKTDGFTVTPRPPFNLLYLGINQKNNLALKDLKVRQALAYALDRETLVKTKMPEGATVAKEFQPDTLAGYAKDVQEYPHDVNKAKQLLAEAGQSNLKLNFY